MTARKKLCGQQYLEVFLVKGFAFRLTGLILGIVGTAVSVTAIVFSSIGFVKSRQCKKCMLKGHNQ